MDVYTLKIYSFFYVLGKNKVIIMESTSFSSLVILTFCLILLEKCKNAWKEEKDVYKMLKDVIDNVLSTSGYSEVNLAKLFQAFTALKY